VERFTKVAPPANRAAHALQTLPSSERKAVETEFASGMTDREIGRRFGVSHMAALRHRRDHLVKPMLAAVATLDRGAAERQLAASVREDPVANVIASLNLAAQANKLATIEGRLERMSVAAEATGPSAGVAALSAQALRSVEVGSRLASTGGYAASQATSQQGEPRMFSISIVFAGSGRTEESTSRNTTAPSNRKSTLSLMLPRPIPPACPSRSRQFDNSFRSAVRHAGCLTPRYYLARRLRPGQSLI
jgi:hypothetical protein